MGGVQTSPFATGPPAPPAPAPHTPSKDPPPKPAKKRGGRPPALSTEQELDAVQRWDAHQKVAQIARELEVAPASVYRALRKHGRKTAPQGGPVPISDETRAEILRLLHAGASYTAAGQATDTSDYRAKRVWRESGETGDPPGLGAGSGHGGGRPVAVDDEVARAIAVLADADVPINAIAEALGLSWAAVDGAVKRAKQEKAES